MDKIIIFEPRGAQKESIPDEIVFVVKSQSNVSTVS